MTPFFAIPFFAILCFFLLSAHAIAEMPAEAQKLIDDFHQTERAEKAQLQKKLNANSKTSREKLEQLLKVAQQKNDSATIAKIQDLIAHLKEPPPTTTLQVQANSTYSFRSTNSIQGTIHFNEDATAATLELFLGLERIEHNFTITDRGTHLLLTHPKIEHNSQHELTPVYVSAIPDTNASKITLRWGGRLKYKTSTAELRP